MSKIPEKRKHFCMAPWVHLHVWPNGGVYPCCMSSIDQPVGNIREKSLREIWNGAEMRDLRLRMLRDEPSETCTRCYETEKIGGHSPRKDEFDTKFRHHEAIVESTRADGDVAKLNLAYLDIRFSNLCNLRCRTCGPHLSSGWFADHAKLYGPDPVLQKLEKAENGAIDLWERVEEILPGVEEIYFAGGEPFLMDEHYRLLDLLIEKKRFDVRLRYSTNFSKPIFNDVDTFALWDRFENVSVGASLDSMGKRAEYLRKGLSWKSAEGNRLRMKEVCPRVRFFIPFTLSLMNALHAPDFHRDWVERGLLELNQFFPILLQFPTYYRIQALPSRFKDQVREKYREHVSYIMRTDPGAGGLARSFESALQFMDNEDRTRELEEFRAVTHKLDLIRGESFADVFPELAELMRIDS